MADVDPANAPMPERKRDRVMRAMRVPLAVRTSDLPLRLASAAVMLGVAALAFWAGTWAVRALISAVGVACFWEWQRMVRARSISGFAKAIWMAGGVLYIGLAAWLMMELPLDALPVIIGVVIFTDSCAYFAGRTFGGPKIAPRISPSKTWAGLAGGMLGAGLFLWIIMAVLIRADGETSLSVPQLMFAPMGLLFLPMGAGMAIAAQMGDFFESWMKRKAAMKDSSNLIPGHGGVFDRIDGLMPVAILVGLVFMYFL